MVKTWTNEPYEEVGQLLQLVRSPRPLSIGQEASQHLNMLLAQLLGGKGGGKPAQAQAQGPNVDAIDDALQAAREFAALKLE